MKKFAIVISRYNQSITQGLLNGALGSFKRHGISQNQIDVFWVPGSFEIPLVCKKISKKKYGAIVTLGCILKGETTHNHYIAQTVTKGLLQISLQSQIPITFGILTPNTRAQALARSGKGSINKGSEAAEAAILMANLLKHGL